MYFDGMFTPPPAVHVPSDAPQGTPVEIAKIWTPQNVPRMWNKDWHRPSGTCLTIIFPFFTTTAVSVFLVHATSNLGSYSKVSLIDVMAFDCIINNALFLSTWNRHDIMSGTLDHKFSPTSPLTSVSSKKHWCEWPTLHFHMCFVGLG